MSREANSRTSRLAWRYRNVASRALDGLLQHGFEDVAVRFGPPVASDRYLLLPAVVTNLRGDVRAADRLLSHYVPHMTLGHFEEGGGWVSISRGSTIWAIAEAPFMVPGRSTPTWSHVVDHEVNVSELLRELSGSDLFEAASHGPLDAEVEFLEDRFVLRGGAALRFYREVQRAVEDHGRSLMRSCWLIVWNGSTSGVLDV